MLFYWLMQAVNGLRWLLKPPPIQQFAMRNDRQQCPTCGWRINKLRCVLMSKPGPAIPDSAIFCQHRCERCGARWHEKPLWDAANPSTVLPAVARDDIERSEDRMNAMQEELHKPETVY